MGESTKDESLIDYVPKRGHFIMLDLTIGAVGHELKKRRPCLVISQDGFNNGREFVVICPTTSTETGDPAQLEIPRGLPVSGFISVDQLRSVDYIGRRMEFRCKCPDSLFREVIMIAKAIIFPKNLRFD